MVKIRKIPLRKSVVSNEIIDKRDLLRIVKNKEGQVFIDPTGKANGRGAYYDELIAYVDHKVKRRELGLE